MLTDIEIAELESELADAKAKAELWDALLSSPRIRVIGTAEIDDPTCQHFTVEVWSRYPIEHRDNKLGQETLTKYADTIRKAKQEEE